jgi:hypothetical protein
VKSKRIEITPRRTKGPIEMAKQGSAWAPIYATTNRTYHLDPVTGQKTVKSEHPQFTVM